MYTGCPRPPHRQQCFINFKTWIYARIILFETYGFIIIGRNNNKVYLSPELNTRHIYLYVYKMPSLNIRDVKVEYLKLVFAIILTNFYIPVRNLAESLIVINQIFKGKRKSLGEDGTLSAPFF